jgi:uncharacterized protein (TIGR02145 family)
MLGMAQSNSNGEMPNSGNTNSEKQALEIKRNAFYNLEEIKVRWKKAALENCPGVPCPTFSAPGPCSSIVATPTGPSSASVSFVPPTSDGGSPITGYTVTATSTPSAPAKRKTTAAIITVSGTSSPIMVTGLSLGINYIFTVLATNAVGPSPTITTVTTVAPCVLNTASAGSTSPTLAVNTILTNITHATTSATGIGTATSLPSGVTASWSANVITISGTPTVTGSFNYIILLTGGCGIVNATGSITVSASPACAAAAASTTPTLTVNTVLTNITHATTSATGIGTASGLPTGVSAAWSSNTITISGTPSITGTFNYTIPLTGTSCSAVNATGTITVSTPFLCGTSTVPDMDGNSYNTVLIGLQCWTQTNLKVTMYNDGTAIPLNNTYTSGTGSTVWQGLRTGAYTIYGNESSSGANATNYGFLYNWYAAVGIVTLGGAPTKNICPTGWHVPTNSDWNILVKSMHSGADTSSTGPSATQSSTAGGYMKSTGNITLSTGLWTSPNTGADNSSFFTALPGGSRDNDGSFRDIRDNAHLWVATHFGILSGNGAYIRILYYYNSTVQKSTNNKWFGASVRCLRD